MCLSSLLLSCVVMFSLLISCHCSSVLIFSYHLFNPHHCLSYHLVTQDQVGGQAAKDLWMNFLVIHQYVRHLAANT